MNVLKDFPAFKFMWSNIYTETKYADGEDVWAAQKQNFQNKLSMLCVILTRLDIGLIRFGIT